MIERKFNAIVDSAWGSSAKGAASTRLAEIHGVKNLSANNYPNAGHTAIVPMPNLTSLKFVSKVLPTGAILKKKAGYPIRLWLGPGTGFQQAQLEKELKETGFDLNGHEVMIHPRAVVVEDRHIAAEAPGGSQSTEHISSTMSGSGAAFSEKMMRSSAVKLARDLYPNLPSPFDFAQCIRNSLAMGGTFLHEVSQGFALSVNYGTHYPACTFRDCTPQQAWADFGLLPQHVGEVYLNIRSFPIRVGNNFRDGIQTGYSGDVLSDQVETSWEKVAADAEMPDEEAASLAEKERTTVTKKIRRVFTFSDQLLRESVAFTGATKLILNFPQYIHWSAFGLKGGQEAYRQLHPKVRAFIDHLEEVANVPVIMLGTGPEHSQYVFLG